MPKKYNHLTKTDRMEIAILLSKEYTPTEIAKQIGKDRSSVYREINRNKTRKGYDAKRAQIKHRHRRQASKYQLMKVRGHPVLESYIEKHMKECWTPEQIAGRWNLEEHKDKEGRIITISAPTIYKYLYKSFGQHLCQYLPSKRYTRKRRKKKKQKREIIKERTFIHDRPEIINSRSRYGDWEADTLGTIREDSGTIVGLVERKSRYVCLSRVFALKNCMNAFKRLVEPFKESSHSVTFDNGVENTRHKELGLETYFCHPYSSWEKGAIENVFQRFRRFIPKGTSIELHTTQQVMQYARIMNNTPRKCLDWKTPREVFTKKIN